MTPATPKRSWGEALQVYTRPRVLVMILLGFSAGLPFLLVFSTLTAWLRDVGIERTVIGFFGWVGITYSIKVFWAPIIDRLPLPWLTARLGRRRSWMLCGQGGIALGLLGLALSDPTQHLGWVAGFALLVAFASATQDISVDAYRIEAVSRDLQGAMASTYVFGYRLALLVAGAGALYIAEYFDWTAAYLTMAALMGVGIVTTLSVREPLPSDAGAAASALFPAQVNTQAAPARPGLAHALRARCYRFFSRSSTWFATAVIGPFADFFGRNGKTALLILLLIGIYKLSDVTMGVMANPFYIDLGFSKKEIADVTKLFGFFMTLFGAALGGVLVARFGIGRPLVLGAVLVATTNLLFAMLAQIEPSLAFLAVVVSADNLSGGLATSAFIAYLSSLTNTAYTATQYALFSSLMTLPAKFLSGFSGVMVDGYGYFAFFVYAGLIGLPAIVLSGWMLRRGQLG